MDFIKDKKGFACVDAIPAILALIIALCAFIDIFIILRKTNVISTTATYIARTIGPQGGVKKNIPNYYKGCTADDGGTSASTCKYTVVKDLYENARDMLYAVGLDEDNFEIYIVSHNSNTDTEEQTLDLKKAYYAKTDGLQTDYGNYLTVELRIHYPWAYTSKILPLSPSYSKSSFRNVISSFKTRTES